MISNGEVLMFMNLRRAFNSFIVSALVRMVFICLLFVLTSCGDDACYYDVKWLAGEDGKGHRNVTKNASIDPKEENPGPVAMISSRNGDEGIANIAVSGFVSMCANTTADMSVNPISVCKGDVVLIKHLCPPRVTQDNFKDNLSECNIPALLDNRQTTPTTAVCKERGVCDSNGIGYRFVRKDGEANEVLEAYGNCGELQGYPELDCDDNRNETVIFYTGDKSVKTVPVNTGRGCTTTTKKISANNPRGVELEKDILRGDIVTLTIDGPREGVPNFLDSSPQYRYQNGNNATINRWADSSSYSRSIIRNCPRQLHFNASADDISACPLFRDGADVMNDISNKRSFWNQSGKGLVLYPGVPSRGGVVCESSLSPCNDRSAVFFNSDSTEGANNDFGVLQKLPGEHLKDQVVVRTIIPEKGLAKLCSKICAPNQAAALGGYTVKVNKMKCAAVNGNPSPCCGDLRGALEYKLGAETKEWKPLSITPKSAGNISAADGDLFQVVNKGEKAEPLYLRVNSAHRQNTSGIYSVKVSYKEYVDGTVSRIIEDVKDLVKYMFFGDPNKPGDKGLLAKFFSNLAGNAQYLQYIRILLLLYIIIYGLAFLLGYVQISQKDLIIRTLKLGLVLTLINKEGYSFLYDNFFRLFIDGPDTLICKSNFVGNCTPGKATFGFIDSPFAILFFNGPTWLKLIALAITSPLGTILILLLLVGIFYFIVGVMTAVVSYLMCILAISVLILISPIFIPFILFDKTKTLFRKWLDLLVRYSLEPVLLVIGLQVLVSLFYAIFRELLNFTVCWKCVWPIDLDAISSVARFITNSLKTTSTVFCIPFFGPYGMYGTGGMLFRGLGILLPSVILLVILSYLIKDYHSFISQMMDQFTGMQGVSGGKDGAVSLFRDKLRINAIENWANKQLRKGVRVASGIHFKTKEDRKEENEAARRKALGWMSTNIGANKNPFIVDPNAKALRSTLSALPKETIDKLQTAGAEGDKAAFELGGTMFKNLSNDKYAYEEFVNGMRALSAMDKKDIEKMVARNSNLKGLEEMHKVLNSQAVQSSFDDLTVKDRGPMMNTFKENYYNKKDSEIQTAAMRRVGGAMFANKELAKSLLDDTRNGELSGKIFELGRRAKIG